MRLGILEAGRPPAPLDEKYDPYPVMFEDLLRPHLPADTQYIDYPVIEDGFPRMITECDAWLITGSAFGIYDNNAFIPRLAEFVKDAAAANIPMVGICFGHQLISNALGGKAAKSSKGWGVGSHSYTVDKKTAWMDDAAQPGSDFYTYVSHQDQVLTPPPGARVLAHSEFCPNAMLAIGDRILTLQSHPEMPSAYVRELYDLRRPKIGDARVDPALASISASPRATDADRVAAWIGHFLQNALSLPKVSSQKP